MSKNNRIIPLVGNRLLVMIIAVFVVIGVGIARSKVFQANDTTSTNHPTFVVQRGPLLISVIESGTIKAREQVIIKSEVEGQTSILSLVAEGTRVKEGDVLVELDASRLLDEKIDQQIRVQNAEAAFVGARENMAVVENQAESDVDKAELAYEFSKEDLKKYIEGEYPNKLKEAESSLTLANEELARAEEKLDWSKKLFKEKYISQTELQADELTFKRKGLDLELAKNNLDLLKNYTHKRNLAQLESDVKQAEMALERTRRKASADVVQARANLEAKKAEFERQKDKLKKIEEQIGKTKIYAPTDGLVIYATSAQSGGFRRHSTEPLQEGQEVRERQELIYLPTTTSSMVEVALHEASLDKVHVGLPVKVTVDALPEKTFFGRVATIAPLPDPQSAWMNPDLKVYDTDIYLDNNSNGLRTGMSCKAEIIIEQHQEATYVPVQAVLRVGGEPTVYVVNGGALKPRKVEIGFDNDRMVRIISGLEPGEVVSLTPPLEAAAIAPTTEEIIDGIGPIQKQVPTPPAPITKETPTPPDLTTERPERGGRPPGPGNPGNLTPEQQERARRFFQDLSPEEREKLRKMSPEERRKFREQMMSRQPSSGVD